MISKVYSPAFYLILWMLLLAIVPQSHAQQPSVPPQEGDTLDNVTISEEEARNIMKGLFDLPRLTHSLALGRIAKDERLTAFTDGFMQRNNIQVLTIGYIDSDEFWPRIFRQQRLNKINKSDNDNLLAAKIIFMPVATDGPPTGYTTTLELTGKTSQVYELLSISQAEVDSIAASTSQQQLGNTTFATPNEAKETVVSALIAALQRVEESSQEEKDAMAADASLEGIQKIIIKEALASARENIEEWQKAVEENIERSWEILNPCFLDREGKAETIIENIDKRSEEVSDLLPLLLTEDASSELLRVIGITFLGKQSPYFSELSDDIQFRIIELLCPYMIEEVEADLPNLVKIEPIEDYMFTPGIGDDKLEIHYSIEATERFPLGYAKIEVFSNIGTLFYSTDKLIEIKKDGIFYWDGLGNQVAIGEEAKFIRRDESPFVVKVSSKIDSESTTTFVGEASAEVNLYVDTFLDNYKISTYIEASSKEEKFKAFLDLAEPMYLEILANGDDLIKMNYQNSLDYLGEYVHSRTFLGKEIMVHDDYWQYLELIDGRLDRKYANDPRYTVGGFNIRFQRGSKTAVSNHSYGMALDIGADWNLFFIRPSLAFLELLTNFNFFRNPSTIEEQKAINSKLLSMHLEENAIDSLVAGMKYIADEKISIDNLREMENSVADAINRHSTKFYELLQENAFLRNEMHFLDQKNAADQNKLKRELHSLLPEKADQLLISLNDNLVVLRRMYTIGYRKAFLVDRHFPVADRALMYLLLGMNFEVAIESLKLACAAPEKGDYTDWVTDIEIEVPATGSAGNSIDLFNNLSNLSNDMQMILGNDHMKTLATLVKEQQVTIKNVASTGFLILDEPFVREFLIEHDQAGTSVVSWGGNWPDRKDYMHFEYKGQMGIKF